MCKFFNKVKVLPHGLNMVYLLLTNYYIFFTQKTKKEKGECCTRVKALEFQKDQHANKVFLHFN